MGGFYYDIQNSNKLVSVSLHANRKLKNKSTGEWTNWADHSVKPPIVGAKDYDSSKSETFKYYEVDNPSIIIKDNKGNSSGVDVSYGTVPLITSIIKENFTVGIANNWAESGFSSTISDAFNSLKPWAPYAKFSSEKLTEMINRQRELKKETSLDSILAEGLMNGAEFIKPYVDKGTEYLNRAMVTQTSRFTNYTGTGISIGGLDMKFTIFPDWDDDGNFITIYDKLNNLYPYFLGKYLPPTKNLEDLYENKETFTMSDLWDTFVGWQLPPGGYQADMRSIDIIQVGTLKLKFGPFYSIDNLVVKDVQMTFSKQLVKQPQYSAFNNGSSLVSKVSPLYCDIQISFVPASKYSELSLNKFTSGSDIKALENIGVELTNELVKVRTENEQTLLKIKSNV